MTFQELKQNILNGTISDELIIFVSPENNFLVDAYINEMCALTNKNKNYITSLTDTTESALALVMNYAEDLNILVTETFSELHEDYEEFTSCVVVCKAVDKRIVEKVTSYVIEVPKLVEWQIKDYMKAICQGLSELDINWLYEATGKDIYRIENELTKLSLLDTDEQSAVLASMRIDPATDLCAFKPSYILSDALIKNNRAVALDFLTHQQTYKVDPIGLVTMTLNKYKNILLLTYKSGIKEEYLELEKKQIDGIKKYNTNIPLIRIMKSIEFLSSVDSRLKSNPSRLDFVGNKKEAMLEYIVLNTLACCD